MLKSSPFQFVRGSLSFVTCLAILVGSQLLLAQEPAKVTYDDHVRPILREHCFACHGQDKGEGGLKLDTYAKIMAGGASGEVVLAGDTGSSRLFALVSHTEEPKMPPKQDKLSVEKLATIQKWIEGGALENTGSKVAVKKKNNAAVMTASGDKRPDGPPILPEGLLKQPVLYTPRAMALSAIASSPWAPLVAVAGQKQISLYNSDTQQLLGILPFPEGIPYVLRFSRSGTVLLAAGGRGGHSGSAVIFDVKTGRRIAKVGEEQDAVLAADISRDHSMVAIGGPSKIVRIYSTETGQMLHEIKKHTDWIYSLRFSPDGVLLATSDRSGGLFVWEAETAREYLNLRGHNGAVYDVNWRPDSNVLASAGEDATIRLWEMNDGNQIKNWGAHGGGAFCVNYTHDGRIATAGRDNTVKLWNGDGAAVKTFPGFTEAALRCTFTHDGAKIVGGDWLGNVHVWDCAEAKLQGTLPANPPTVALAVDAKTAEVAAKTAAAAQVQAVTDAAAKAVADKDAQIKAATDKLAAITAASVQAEAAKSLPLTNAWNLTFPSNLGAPPHVTLEKLLSWTEHPIPGVRYFSGSANYETTFDVPTDFLDKNAVFILDLGKVKNFAEVRLNGKSLETLWKPPFRLEVTGLLQSGENHLSVRVTNLWPNRLIGDAQLPDEVEWDGNAIKAWPQWLLENKPRPKTNRITFATWRFWNKDSTLVESGLIGPVTLYAVPQLPLSPGRK